MKDRFHCELHMPITMGEVKFSFSSVFIPADVENAMQWLFVFLFGAAQASHDHAWRRPSPRCIRHFRV